MPKQHDVVIVGAGVIGCSIAYHLARKGIAAQIIERESIGARASGKAWAVQVYPANYFVTERMEGTLFAMPEGETMRHWIDLYWLGYHRMADIALDIQEKGGIDIEYSEMPRTMIATDEEKAKELKESVAYLKENGFYEAEWLDRNDVRKRFPTISHEVKGAMTVPCLQWEPYKYTLGLAQAAEKMGADVKQGEVVGFGTKGEKITSVKLASGTEIEADAVVIAMGPWSGQGTARLGNEIPILVNMEECLRMEVPSRLPLNYITNGVNGIVSKVNGDVILGLAGQPHFVDDFDSSLSEEVKMNILEGAIGVLPELEDAKLVEHRGDLEGWAPGPVYNKPVLGRLPEWENGYIAARFGTLGMTQSAGTGKVMADLIVDGEAPLRVRNMMDYLSPDRL